VHVRGLTKRFGDFLAVDDVSLDVPAGEVFGYLGPNGSGKTTTLRMLLGLLRPSSGEARLLGCDPQTEAEKIRRRVGYMSQRFALYDELTALENLRFYAGVFDIRERSRPEAVLELLGLSGTASLIAGKLPGGWRQRLALAVAILHRPEILILDEPTSGVDPLARRAFWELIYRMADGGATVVVTTHYMDEAEYCARVGVMREGRLLAVGTPSALKHDLFRGLAWDLAVGEMLAAVEVLPRLDGVARVGLAGERLRVITHRTVTEDRLSSYLRASGVQVVELSIVEPTLEDVFLSLAGD
jgi:ABC-2 type transport system ATP-binding protein